MPWYVFTIVGLLFSAYSLRFLGEVKSVLLAGLGFIITMIGVVVSLAGVVS